MDKYPVIYCQSCKIPLTMVGKDSQFFNYECLRCRRERFRLPIERAATAKAVIPEGVIIEKETDP